MPRYPIDSLLQGTAARIGSVSAGNYSEFDQDGTMRARGGAVCWRDELQSLFGQRLDSPSGDIDYDFAEGSVRFQSSCRYPADFVVVNHQLNHDWVPGSTIDPHLHWWQDSSAFPNWLIEYRWQKMKQGQVKTTVWTPLAYTGHAFTYTAGTINQITDFGPFSPPANYGEVSDVVQFKLYRDVTNVSTLFSGAEVGPANVEALNFDTHIQIDQLGSDEEYAKY